MREKYREMKEITHKDYMKFIKDKTSVIIEDMVLLKTIHQSEQLYGVFLTVGIGQLIREITEETGLHI